MLSPATPVDTPLPTAVTLPHQNASPIGGHFPSRLIEPRLPPGTHSLLAASRFLDDTAVIGAGVTQAAADATCAQGKQRLKETMDLCGEVYAEDKDEAPGPTFSFLGVLVDSVLQEARISPERLESGLRQLRHLAQQAFVPRKELERLCGVLQFCAKCSPPARTFMQNMYTALRRRGRYVRLNRGIRADIAWWLRFWEQCNRVSLLLDSVWEHAEELRFWTDASFTGWGAAFETPDGPQFFYGTWAELGLEDPEGNGWHISELELLVVAMACDTWGQYLAGRRIITRCDNEASVHTINRGRCDDAGMMVIMRELFHVAAKHGFAMRSKHIGTKENVLADSASRGNLKEFYAFALDHFGWRAEDLSRVPITLDCGAVLARMRRAHIWRDTDSLEVARRSKARARRQRSRRRPGASGHLAPTNARAKAPGLIPFQPGV